MDETSLEQSIDEYTTQLAQVQAALAASDADDEDLVKLQEDLQLLIKLTTDSLIDVKKRKLLSEIDLQYSAITGPIEPVSNTTSCDSEFGHQQVILDKDEDIHLSELTDHLSALEGSKCQAPFSYDWGMLGYHNALVVDVEVENDASSLEAVKVKVMFCNPRTNEMRPCPFYLEGSCRFNDDCRYSHGYEVKLDELREYDEPDFSLLIPGVKCLAKFSDHLWYDALIESVSGEEYVVKYLQYGNTASLNPEDILPIASSDDSSTSDSDTETDKTAGPSELLAEEVTPDCDSESICPAILWSNNVPTQSLGDWEKYTKGIGSKLMFKMGYIHGHGLGRNGEGRLEPIEAIVLPQGKSLDKIMELKEIAGGRDLNQVNKKLKRKQRKAASRVAAGYIAHKKSESVFDFLNSRLAAENPELRKKTMQLKNASTNKLNLQSFQVAEEIKRTEKDVADIQKAILRNDAKNKTIASQLRCKLQARQEHLQKIQAKERTIHKEQHRRVEDKKLMIF